MTKAKHDQGYKALFSEPRMVEALLRGFVPGEWVDQLCPGGNLFILWTPYDIDAYIKKLPGDCFGGTFQEYVSMMEHHVGLVDLIYCGRHRVVFAGEKRHA